MPTYEFRCPDGHAFDRFYRKISDARLGSRVSGVRQDRDAADVGGAGLVFKGSGFYLTDYGKNAHRGGTSARTDRESSDGESSSDARASPRASERRRRAEVRASRSRRDRKSATSKSSGSQVHRVEVERGAGSGSTRRRLIEHEVRQMMDGTELLRAELVRAAQSLGAPDPSSRCIERPRDPSFGDWATNLAMVLAKPLGRKPRDLAKAIVERLDFARAGISAADIAGPGFINFRVSADVFAEGLRALIAAGDQYGRSNAGQQCAGERRVRVGESDRPAARRSRPAGRARRRDLVAARGDRLARHARVLLQRRRRADHESRAQRAGARAPARRRGRRRSPRAATTASTFAISRSATSTSTRPIRTPTISTSCARSPCASCARSRTATCRRSASSSTSTSSSRRSTPTAESTTTIERLVAAGHTYEKDGALWLKTTDFGDDKDRVMRRSAEKGGEPTYFLPDVAYHITKWERGFKRAINVQGADHHSTVTRVRVGLQALDMGIPQGYPEYVLHQMVTVMRGGEEVKISKRAGSYVTVRDLIDEVGRDAVRYFFLMRKGDSQLVFDVDVARSQSEENPVYYIQMAHARMSGIFRVGEIDASSRHRRSTSTSRCSTLPEEQELMKALLDFPSLVAGAAEALEPHRVATYLHDTAGKIHLWYHKAHVLNEPEPIMRARLVLARASQLVLRNGLALLGITAPERM